MLFSWLQTARVGLGYMRRAGQVKYIFALTHCLHLPGSLETWDLETQVSKPVSSCWLELSLLLTLRAGVLGMGLRVLCAKLQQWYVGSEQS